jgi:hypothetical protein
MFIALSIKKTIAPFGLFTALRWPGFDFKGRRAIGLINLLPAQSCVR